MCPAVPTTTDRVIPSPAPWLAPQLTFAAPGPLLPLLFELRLRLRPPRTALPFPHPVEDLDKTEIDLSHLHVDADHLHLDLVAEAIDLVGVLSAQQVRALDEPVLVVCTRRDMDQPLDEVLDQFDEQAKGGDAGDVAFEFIADLVGHELHLLP